MCTLFHLLKCYNSKSCIQVGRESEEEDCSLGGDCYIVLIATEALLLVDEDLGKKLDGYLKKYYIRTVRDVSYTTSILFQLIF